MPLRGGTARPAARPVVAVEGVALIADGTETVLSAADYRVDIVEGAARVSVPGAGGDARVRILYRAGLADAAEALPAAIRHGILRMAQHFYEARDDKERPPPAAIAALWHPWRRTTLGSGR